MTEEPRDSAATQPVALRFHHVGVAVKDLDAALATHVGVFGMEQAAAPVEVAHERVRVCFVTAEPGVRIELVEGLDETSPVQKIAGQVGLGAYHICYEVDDLDAAIVYLKSRRCFAFKRFEMADHGRFAFLLTPERQLFELCEPAAGPGG